MKRVIFYTAAALMMAGSVLTGCSGADEMADVQPETQKTFRLSVNASKGAATRTLTDDGTSLSAAWNSTDVVAVYKGETKVGELTPEAAAATSKLTGEVTGVEVNDNLVLKFGVADNYAVQDGTLDGIDATCNYAEAEVTVTEIAGDAVTTTDAAFENQQSIFKFSISDYQGDPLSVDNLVISIAGVTAVTVTPSEAKSELYAALPAVAEASDFQFDATSGTDNYSFAKKDATVTAGKFFTSSLKMQRIRNLSALSAELVAQDGDILTGTAPSNYKISVADGATVTLKDVDITSFDSEGPKYAGINCIGDATLSIEGENHVKGANNECSGIHVPEGKTLTIEGSGKLTAESNGYGAGIGAGYYWGAAGNIVINSGEIIAIGGGDNAGIGAGTERACGDITINGGVVTATSKYQAGIGSGYHSRCGKITITGGTVTATGGGGDGGAGIGAAYENASCGDITISGGNVTATGGNNSAGIGSGYRSSSCGNILISGGTVTATGGNYGPGIGAGATWYRGYQSSCGNITITGGTIIATKGGGTYDIGPGDGRGYDAGTCGTVTIGAGIVIKDENGEDATIYVAP